MNETSTTSASPRVRWPAISVRTRIVAAITTVAALGLVAVGVSVYLVERQLILEQVDARLAANLDSARYIVAGQDPDAAPPAASEPGDPADETLPDTWTSSLDALGAVVQRMSPDDNVGVVGIVEGAVALVPGFRLDLDLQDEAAFAAFVSRQAALGEPVIGTYAEDGVLWRYLAAPIAVENSPEPAEVLFVMAYDLDAELAEINVAARVFLVASIIVVLLIAATGTIVATRLLRPLRRMRETAERVSGQSLSERLPIDGRDDVSELARTMNDMLDRLDEALDSQRRLLSDVGHELKTPITIVRGYVEVMDPEDPADVRDTQTLAADELDRMGQLVQDLAGAASLHGPSPIQPRPVDTADLMQQIIRKAEGIEGADVTTGAIDDTVTVIDPARITQAMLQLAQNAVTHGGGALVMGCRAPGDAIEFWVRDFGPGVPDDQKTAVFERFHRGGDSAARPGSGLGLNIVQVIARAHGGGVRVVDAPSGGAVFLLSLPHRAQPPARGPRDSALGPVPPRPPLPPLPALPARDLDSQEGDSRVHADASAAGDAGTVKGG